MQLRPYQLTTIENVKRDWFEKNHSDVLAVLATGLGKTAIFLALLIDLLKQDPSKRALILVHRAELAYQPVERIATFWPEWKYRTGIVMADLNETRRSITVATVQTLSSERRLQQLLVHGAIDYLVTDEAHHSNATSYLALVAKLRAANPNLKHLGVTATPLRADGDGLSKVFQHCSHKVSIKDGVKGRYLVPVKALAISTKISLRGVKSAQGDFVQSQLKHVFETDNCLDLVVATHQKYAAERQAICFTVSVDGAHTLAEKFNEVGISSAAIDGTTAKEERKRVLRAFQAGEIKVLCNCMVLTEGFDAPAINAVHMVRPTKSDSLYVQCIGRGLRPAPEKEDCLIFDYAPAETRNIVMAGDVLGVPAEIKKEQDKAQDDLEQGDAFAGFTFDGEARGVEGDPLELVARELNYLDITPYAWQKNEGYLTLSIKQGKTLVITPLRPSQDAQNLLLVTSEKGRPAHVEQLLDAPFVDLTDYAQAYADEHGDPVFQSKDRSWRKRGVTEKQIELLRKFGFRNDTIFRMTADEASKTISWRFTKQALRNARWLY
jgi:ATP-dependent helicase IRC3